MENQVENYVSIFRTVTQKSVAIYRRLNLRASPAKGRRGEMGRPSMSQDSLATSSRPRTAEPSTDSLSESQTSNRYATYTKQKHAKGSAESIKTAMNVEPAPVSTTENKMKTKIPVYLNQGPKYRALDNRNSRDQQKWNKPFAPKTTNVTNNKPNERKVPGSLMNATKSTSAKIVPKVPALQCFWAPATDQQTFVRIYIANLFFT